MKTTPTPVAAKPASVTLAGDTRMPAWFGRIQSYLKVASIAGAAVIALVLLLVYWQMQRSDASKDAFAALASADSSDGLVRLASENRGTAVGEQASFTLARRAYDEGKFDQAAAKFTAFLQSYPQSLLVNAARLGQGYALDASGKTEPARKAFTDLAKSVTNPDLAAEAYLAAGRCAESMGLSADAEKLYNSAITSGSTGIYKQQALDALKELKRGVVAKSVASLPPTTPEAAVPPAK